MVTGKLPGAMPPTRERSRARLLVSVRDADEARAAVAGGADIVDAKDPAAGALGPVTPEVLIAIMQAVPESRPVSAALGDLPAYDLLSRFSDAVPRGRLAFGKIGLAGSADVAAAGRALERAGAWLRNQAGADLVVVAYADWAAASAPAPDIALTLARSAGAAGLLLDTAGKDAGGVMQLWSTDDLAALSARVHAAGMFMSLGGSLTSAELPRALAVGADIIGIRGAACGGGRQGRIETLRVRALRQSLDSLAPRPGASSHSSAAASSRGPVVRQLTPAGSAFRK